MNNTAAALADHDLSPEAVAVLRAGVADGRGLCCSPGQVEKNFAALRECERFGLLRFLDVERPWITDAGRAAVGAPSERDASLQRLRELSQERRKRLIPEKRNDPRTDFDYRSYRSCGYVCTLVIKQPDARYKPNTIRVGRSLTSDPQFLGPKNSIVLDESEGRFVLAVMPKWLTDRAAFRTYPLALDETDPDFTDEERATWERLRQVCYSVNSRIRTAGRRPRERRRFGEYA